MHFQFDYFCSVATYVKTFCCRSVYYYNTYSMKQPDLYYFKTIKVTSQAQSVHREYSPTRLQLVFSIQDLTRLMTSFLWFQNCKDQAVS